MVRLLRLLYRTTALQGPAGADGRPASNGVWRFLLWLGLLGAAYAVARRFGTGAVPSTHEVRQRAGDALPGDAHEIAIREPGETAEGDTAEDDDEGGDAESDAAAGDEERGEDEK